MGFKWRVPFRFSSHHHIHHRFIALAVHFASRRDLSSLTESPHCTVPLGRRSSTSSSFGTSPWSGCTTGWRRRYSHRYFLRLGSAAPRGSMYRAVRRSPRALPAVLRFLVRRGYSETQHMHSRGLPPSVRAGYLLVDGFSPFHRLHHPPPPACFDDSAFSQMPCQL